MPVNEYDALLAGDGQQQGNEYDKLITDPAQAAADAQAQRVRQAAQAAASTTPDAAAETQTLADQFKVPPTLVARNKDLFRAKAQTTGPDYDAIIKQSPALAGVLEDPTQHAIVKDDLAPLGALEWLVTAWPRAIAQGLNENRYGALRTQELFGRTLTPAERDEMASAKYNATVGGELGADGQWWRGAVTGLAKFGTFLGEASKPGLAVGAAGAAAGAVTFGVTGGPEAIIPGAVAGGRAGFSLGESFGLAKTALESSAGPAYDQISAFHDETGHPIDPAVARIAALGVGTVNGLLMGVSGDVLLKRIPGAKALTDAFTTDAVEAALRRPTVRDALAKLATRFAGPMAAGTALMAGQEAATIIGGELAKTADARIGTPQPRPDWVRADGTTKGSGYLGVLARPDGGVSSELTIADSADPRLNVGGTPLDYPAIVPTLTQDEVTTLLTLPDGAPIPQAIKDKAEAHALARLDKGESVFAQPGEADTTMYPTLARSSETAFGDHPGIPHITEAEVRDRMLGAIASGAQSFALASLIGPSLAFPYDVARARSAANNGRFFDALAAGVTDSKTAKRAPAAAQAFLARATKDGPVETVYAPLNTFTSYWQSQGVDPAKMAATLTGDDQAYARAQAQQTDLPIPTARYATTLAGTEHNTFFAQELRLGDPRAMNAREAQALFDTLKAPLPPSAPGVADPLREGLVDQLTAAGFDARSTTPIADTLAGVFQNVAERATGADLQVDPADLANRYATSISREGLTPAEPTAATAAAPTEIPESIGGNHETATQRRARIDAHTAALVSSVTRDALAQDPTVDPALIKHEVEWRLGAFEAGQREQVDSGQDPGELLRAIAGHGGLSTHDASDLTDLAASVDVRRRGRRGLQGPITWKGVAGVFKSDRVSAVGRRVGAAKTMDGMREALVESGHLSPDTTLNEFHDRLTTALSLGSVAGTAIDVRRLPGTADLGELGIRPGTRWWDHGEDTSFDFAQAERTYGPLHQVLGPMNAKGEAAYFIGTQEGFEDLPAIDLYNVHGGEHDGATVSTTELKAWGIEVPPMPGQGGDPIDISRFDQGAAPDARRKYLEDRIARAQAAGQEDVEAHQELQQLMDAEDRAAPPAPAADPWRLADPPRREASTFKEARAAATTLQGKELKNIATGEIAMVGRNAIDKMLQQKAVGQSTSPREHALAVANLDQLFERAILGETHPDRDGNPDIKAVQRWFAPLRTPDGVRLVKLTVLELAAAKETPRLYTVQSIEVEGGPAVYVGNMERLAGDSAAPHITRPAGPVSSLADAIRAHNRRGISPADEHFQPFFHGSPHDFEKFSSDKIGTGEGAQAYGHGLYFAENPDVANDYSKNVIHTAKFEAINNRLSALATQMDREAIPGEYRKFRTPRGERLAAEYDRLLEERANIKGIIYQVDIPDEHVAKMLDWDKPLSEQPAVIEWLRHSDMSPYGKESLGWREAPAGLWEQAMAQHTGEALYEAVADTTDAENRGSMPYVDRRVAASRLLNEAGIPGIKYLDWGSRGRSGATLVAVSERDGQWFARIRKDQIFTTSAGQPTRAAAEAWAHDAIGSAGTHNVVVFDDSIITLTHKDGTPVSAKERHEFFQPVDGGDEKRGRVQFTRDAAGHISRTDVNLLRTADPSTFLHETGHIYLELLGELTGKIGALDPATLTDSQRQLLGDYGAILQWFGVENASEITTAQHEQFARGFEAYLFEGNAPSVELRSAFAQFRSWLVGVYRSLTALQVELTPAVRGVFDRLVATDAAIAAAQAEAPIAPLFTDAKSAGMLPLEFASYQDQVRQASTRAQEDLQARLLRALQREQSSAWKAQRETVRAGILETLGAEPVYRALSVMRTGAWPDGTPVHEGQDPVPIKLSRDSLVGQFGRAILAQLPKPYVYAADSGISADTAAELFGFSSGDELVKALIGSTPIGKVADAQADAAMFQQYGDPLVDGRLADLAREAVEGEHRQAIVRVELEALTKGMVQATIPSADTLRFAADEAMAVTRIRDLRPGLFLMAAQRASKRAFDLLANNSDRAGAVRAKLLELQNLAHYRAARDAKDNVESWRTRLQSYTSTAAQKRFGKAGADHLDQINAFLDRYELAKVSQVSLDRRTSLRAFAEKMADENLPVDIPQSLLDDARRVNYQNVTLDDFRGVYETVEQIAHLARLKNELLKSSTQATFEQARDRLTGSIELHNDRVAPPLEFRSGLDELKRKVADGYASLSKIAMLARALDGHEDGGEMWEQIIRPLNAAADAEQARSEVEGPKLRAIIDAAYPGREFWKLNEKRFIPEINGSLSKEGRLMVALNWGNQTSRDRILADPTRKWNQAQVEAILGTLDHRDWTFVQGVFDYVNSFWPEIAAKQQRVVGLAPEKVLPLEITTRFGTFPGGYFPLVYDGRLVARADVLQKTGEANLLAHAAYVSASTRRGHTEARKENVKLSVRLDLGVLYRHLDQVIHDLTHHETIVDVSRLLGDGAVQDAIYATKGDRVYQQFTAALKDIALNRTGAAAEHLWDEGANFMRTGTQLSSLAFNIWTMVQQPFGILNGMDRVGPSWVLGGMKRWLTDAAHMENTAGWIHDVSPMMKSRGDTATQDLRDLHAYYSSQGGWFDQLVRTVTLDTTTQRDIVDAMLWHIGLAQQAADIPTWLGAYEKAMHADASDEARAIALADQAVLDSQGGGQIKDLAKVQRGGPWARLFLTFYSYGNTVINATADAYGRAQPTWRRPTSVGKFLVSLAFLHALPALGTVALARAFGKTGGAGQDNWFEEFSKQTVSSALNGIPLARELTGLFNDGVRGYAGPAGARAIGAAYDFGTQLKQGVADKGLERAALQVAGVAFRFPSAQVQRSIDGFLALREGRTHNPMALLTGAPPKAAAR